MWCGLAISNICMNDGLTLLVAAEQSSSRCLLCYERKQVVFEIRWHCLVAAAWRGMPAPCGEATAAATAAQQLETRREGGGGGGVKALQCIYLGLNVNACKSVYTRA